MSNGCQESNRYEIKTVNDFLKVPEDKINICLEEFAGALKTLREMGSVTALIMEAFNVKNEEGKQLVTMPSFTWIDDGERNQKLTLSVKGDK